MNDAEAFPYLRYIEDVWNGHNSGLAGRYFAERVVFHDLNPNFDTTTSVGLDAVKQLHSMLLNAFPDVRFSVLDVMPHEDRLAVRAVFSGTHLGDFLGVKATGKTVTVADFVFYRISKGRITDVWSLVDLYGLMQQIGAIPKDGSTAG